MTFQSVTRSDAYAFAAKKKCISDGELKKLKSHIDNGDGELDNSALESYRKKIIDELGRKSSVTSEKRPISDFRNPDPRRNFSRFSAPNRQFQRGGFRMNNNDQRRNNFNNRGGGGRGFFPDRNRRQREK